MLMDAYKGHVFNAVLFPAKNHEQRIKARWRFTIPFFFFSCNPLFSDHCFEGTKDFMPLVSSFFESVDLCTMTTTLVHERSEKLFAFLGEMSKIYLGHRPPILLECVFLR